MQSWKENTTGWSLWKSPPWGSPGKSEGPYWTRVGISISKINLRKGGNRHGRNQGPKGKDHKII